MGADLCGHVLIGPRELDQGAVDAAVEHVKTCLDQQAELRKIITEASTSDEAYDEACVKVCSMLEQAPFRRCFGSVMEEFQIDAIDEALEMDFLGGKAPEVFVAGFVGAWAHKCRDSMGRSYEDPRTHEIDTDFQIFVAGERTWGNGPEKDSAWWYCEVAAQFGLFDLLGIC
jgi:hypothetical protein